MSEITAVFDDVKDAVGDKGFLILGAVVLGIFVINLVKKDDSDATGNTLVQASGYTAYPSVEQNANVIIDTLQNSIDYAQGSIMEQNKENFQDTQDTLNDMYSGMSEQLGELGSNIQYMNDDMKDYLADNFSATNDYINSGLQSQMELINQNNSQLTETINTFIENNKTYPTGKLPAQTQPIYSTQPIQTISDNKIPTPRPSKDATFDIPVKRKGLNTNTSIVDALKSVNADSSFESRTKIESANGIKNYRGTYQQNVTMLSKMKAGKLKRA